MTKQEKVIHLVQKLSTWEPSIEPDLVAIKAYMGIYRRHFGEGKPLKRSEIIFNAKIAAINLIRHCTVPRSSLKCGFVYIISNKAWENMYKVGISYDPLSRLAQYQTYSPYRDYKLEGYYYFCDKKKAERILHKDFKGNYEWVYLKSLTTLRQVLKQKSDISKIVG